MISPGGTVRIATVAPVPRVLTMLGVDPVAILSEADLDPRLFDDPENQVSYSARSHLMQLCVARTGCKHFGLMVGQQSGLQSLGLLGLLVKCQANVGAAIRSLVDFQHLHVRGATVTLGEDRETVWVSYAIQHPGTEATDQIGDAALAILFNMLGALCGPEWSPTEVRFAHRKPRDEGPFRRFFRAPLVFDAEQNTIAFSTGWLGRPLPAADADLYRLLGRHIQSLEVHHRGDLPSLVRGALRTALLTDRCTTADIARLFSMHVRTLHRHLHAHGTTFRALADEGREEIARQLLQDTSMDVNQIALALNYADDSAFSRAFRRWTGVPPARWRARRSAE